MTTVTVGTDTIPASADLETVFDTGGGPNGVIYYSNSSTPPECLTDTLAMGRSP